VARREAGHENLIRYGAFEAVLDFLRRTSADFIPALWTF